MLRISFAQDDQPPVCTAILFPFFIPKRVHDIMTAFGRAMLATIGGQPQTFHMSMVNGPAIDMDCRDFARTRPEEDRLLDGITLPDDGSVLDWGCGVGRHLQRVREKHPSVHCYGIDICDLMLDHCRRTIAAPATFANNFEALPEREFDLILLMGNGLGVFGIESAAEAGLRRLVGALTRGGRLVIETSNFFGQGYHAPAFTIDAGGYHDGPFTWGYADRLWVRQTLEALGCTVTFGNSHAPGGMFFFAIAQRE